MSSVFSREYWRNTWQYLTDFDREKTLPEKFCIVVGLLAANLLYVALILWVLNMVFSAETLQKYIFWGWLTGNNNVQSQLFDAVQYNWGIAIFFTMFLAPIWEEFVFRAYWFWKKLRKRDKEEMYMKTFVAVKGRMPIWDFVVMSSMIFGICHGGPINILIQGVGGLFLAYAFLICRKSYLSAVLLHAGFNGMLLLAVYIGSQSALSALTLPYWLLMLK